MSVVRLTRQDIIDLYELREALEMFAVAKAARQVVRKVDLDRLQAMTDPILALRDELKRSGNPELDEDQMNQFVAYDLGFHVHLMRMAANARILKVVNETRLLMRIFGMRRKGHTVALLDDIHRRHSEVLDAVAKSRTRNAPLAPSRSTLNSARMNAWPISISGNWRLPCGKRSRLSLTSTGSPSCQ